MRTRDAVRPVPVVAGLLLIVSCQAGLAEELSASRLGLHLIARYSPGARAVVAAGPRVLKVLDLTPEMMAALRDYKARWPEGLTVLRVYTQQRYAPGADPRAAGAEWWEKVLAPALSRLSGEERRLVDYVEGPNECEHYPVWESVAGAQWYAAFTEALVARMAAAGFRPCVGSIPVGNPPGTPEEIEARILAFAPGLLAAKRAGGVWSYHAYSLKYSTDLGEELWTSLRYRRLHEALARRYPELATLPLILTEGGVDLGGNPQADGWQARGDAGRFEDWLRWFDARLREDPYVLGVTLFQCGDTQGWPSFDTEPISAWLAGHLASQRATGRTREAER